jgi:hypothetical protein
MKRKTPASRPPPETKGKHRGNANPGIQAQTRKVMRTHYAAKYRVR